MKKAITNITCLLLLGVTLGINAAERLDPAEIEAAFNATVMEHMSIEPAVNELRKFVTDGSNDMAKRVNAQLTIAHLYWRFGDFDSALSEADKALAIRETADGVLLKARLLDASGDTDDAIDWYRKAEQLTDREEEREFIRIRLTMTEVNEQNVQALVDLAGARDQAFRNRSAVALGVLGHPEASIGLYQPREELGSLFRQHVRQAEWAIMAGELEQAQGEAWSAYNEARARTDQLYALAVMVEAYRKAGQLQAMIDHLAAQAADDEDLKALRIDLLVETEQYEEAIREFRKLKGDAIDMAAANRLIALYQAAGQTDELVRAYEGLIEAEPQAVQWYVGLAAHYLGSAKGDRALNVWKRLENNNREQPYALYDGARSMVQMGFRDEAVAMVERYMAANGDTTHGLMFMFETFLAAGEDEAALKALDRFRAVLGPRDGEWRDLADAYERLSRPDRALEVFLHLEEAEGGLGYDERMRLAWLYSVDEQKEKALELWWDIWLSVDSPARRSFAEAQLLMIAAELNVLADIVVETEDKLATGKANRNDINLLVKIYVLAGDKLSAIEVIEEFARNGGVDEIERLSQLGHVYMLMQDYAAYDAALRRLVEIDSENEVEHIQNIILNLQTSDLASGRSDYYEEIQHWLGELRKHDAEAVSGEFEASILSLAGFQEKAIEAYRRALVEQPDNSDNLLLLSDLMKNNGQVDEAVALLQYVAEHAREDNEFVVAVDGIINMIGQRSFGQELSLSHQAIFRWTHRIILERITARAEKFYLYRLLADIAQETNNREGEFLAMENSLSQAGIRRPSILRELVTMSTPDAGFTGISSGGDLERKLTYGRRLIALQQQLPPEVYIGLGETLLQRGDVLGAEQAFDMIEDVTGLIDINKTKADLFFDEGYTDQALSYYNQALVLNRQDLELLVKTALVRELNGQPEVANRLYFQALQNLLKSQPFVLANRPQVSSDPMAMMRAQMQDTSVNRDYTLYFENLAQGYLLTLPEEGISADDSALLGAMVNEEIQAVLASAEASRRKELSDYSRLDHLTQFVRRVAEHSGKLALAAETDRALMAHFPADPQFSETVPRFYRAWGQFDFAAEIEQATGAPDPQFQTVAGDAPTLQKRQQAASAAGEFESALQLAALSGDSAKIEELCRERVAAGQFAQGLGYARSLLDDEAFVRFVSSVSTQLARDELALLTMINEQIDLVLDIEKRIGRPLMPVNEVLEKAASPEYVAYEASQFLGANGLWKYLEANGSIEDQLGFLGAKVERLQRNADRGIWGLAKMPNSLWKQELQTEQRRELVRIVTELLSKQDYKNEMSLPGTLGVVLVPDVHPSNRFALGVLADYWDQRAQSTISARDILDAFLDGSDEEVFHAMLQMSAQGFGRYSGIELSEERRKGVADQRKKYLAGLLSGEPRDAAEARTVYEMSYQFYWVANLSEIEQRELAELLEKMVELYPEDSRYHLERVSLYRAMGLESRETGALATYYRAFPGDEFARAALYLRLVGDEMFAQALEVRDDGGSDLSDPAVIEGLVEKAEQRGGRGGLSGISIFQQVTGTGGNRWTRWPQFVERSLESLRGAVADENREPDPLELRAVWRGRQQGDQRFMGYPGADMQLMNQVLALPAEKTNQSRFGERRKDITIGGLIDKAEDSADSRKLMEAMATESFAAREYDAWLKALDPQTRATAPRLYDYSTKAWQARQDRDAHRRELTGTLRDGSISDHDLFNWMSLVSSDESALPGADARLFRERFSKLISPTSQELRLAAEINARAGDTERAADQLRLLATQLIQHNAFASGRVFFGGAEAAVGPRDNLSALIADAQDWLPPETAAAVTTEILGIARHPLQDEMSQAAFDTFVLKALGGTLPPAQALEEAVRISPTSVRIEGGITEWQTMQAIELMRLNAMAGNSGAALDILRLAVTRAEIEEAETDGGFGFNQERYANLRRFSSLLKSYGVDYLSNDHSSEVPGLHEHLVALSGRVFTGDEASQWQGSAEWTAEVGQALLGWLGEDGIDVDNAEELVLVSAFRLHEAGESESANRLVAELSRRILDSDRSENVASVTNLAVTALYLGTPLPEEVSGLVAGFVARGYLPVDQDVALLQQLAESGDASLAIDAVRKEGLAADKLAVMKELESLAQQAGDTEFAAGLAPRIAAAEKAGEKIDRNRRLAEGEVL